MTVKPIGTVLTALLIIVMACGCKNGCGGSGVAEQGERESGPPIEGKEKPQESPAKEYVGEIERLGKEKVDYLVVGIDAPSLKDIFLEEKLLAYWLNMAAIAGNDIMYLQNHRFALPIKTMLEDVYLASESGDPEMVKIRKNLLDYLKYIWINHGQYDHRSSIKFVPNHLTRRQLVKIVGYAMERGAKLDFLEGKTVEKKLEPLMPHIFNRDFEKRMTVTDKGADIIGESYINLYDVGINAQDLEAVDDEWKKRLNVRFALQDGKVVPQLFSVGCAYDGHIKRIVKYLEEALKYAPEGEFRDSLELLINYYESGEEDLFRQHSIKWIGLSDNVEYVNGFIEQLKDPRGVIGNFEGMVAVKADSKIVDRIITDSLYFENKMPWPDKYKRDKVKKATATIVEVLMGTGDMGPVPWGGYNLPNYDDIRREYGSKNVILLNIINSYSKTDREKVIGEFYLEEYRPLVHKYADSTRKILIYLHEIAGHGSGKSDPALKDDPRNLMGRNFSSLEECRADAVALYHVGDKKLIEYGLYGEEEAKDIVLAAYVIYLTRHLVQIGSCTEDIITEAHDRASHLIFKYLLTGGALNDPMRSKKDYGVEIVEKEGKHFIRITDVEKAGEGIESLLGILQETKSTADVARQDKLFDGIDLEVNLRKEITERKNNLELATQRVLVYPHLSLVKDESGKVVDVAVKNDEDLPTQQLRFSKINNM